MLWGFSMENPCFLIFIRILKIILADFTIDFHISNRILIL